MNIDKKILIKNEKRWIALSSDYKTLLGANKDLKKLQETLRKLKVKNAIISFMPPFNKSLSPRVCRV